MKFAISIEIPLSEFWDMTLYEINLVAEDYREKQKIRQKSEQKQLTHQAYLISRWVWAKDIKIKEILESIDEEKHEEKKEMTSDQMLNQVKVLNALFGGTINKNS